MSEFVFLFRSTPAQQHEAIGTPELAQKTMQTWLAWIRGLESKGQLHHPGQPLDRGGKVVRGPSTAVTVTDGPFAEAKDIVLGFIVIQAPDLAHAVDIAKTCPIAIGGGSVEVRPVMNMSF